jgi:surface protein
MGGMFLAASSFNQNLARWNVAKVIDMVSMFSEAANFNHDISRWNVSSVENMEGMFANAVKFNQDLCPWGSWISPSTKVTYVFDGTNCINRNDPNPLSICYNCN